jgi:hypothetical protein
MRPLFRSALAGLLTVRLAVIVAIACVIGGGAGALAYLAFHSLWQALLAAGSATGGSTGLLNQIIGGDAAGPTRDQHDDQTVAPG